MQGKEGSNNEDKMEEIRSYEIVLSLSITPKSNDGKCQSSYTAYELKITIGDLREHGQRASEFLSNEFKRFVDLQNKIEISKQNWRDKTSKLTPE